MSVTDVLAVAAIALAVITLILDVGFFIYSKNELNNFITETNRRQDVFVDRQNERQDKLYDQVNKAVVESATVLAQVSERAKIVQEQVDKQMARMTDFVMAQATSKGTEISSSMEEVITGMSERLDALKADHVDKSTIDQMRADLDRLRKESQSIPQQLATTARESLAVSQLTEELTNTDELLLAVLRNGYAKSAYRPICLSDALDLVPLVTRDSVKRMDPSKLSHSLLRLHNWQYIKLHRVANKAIWDIPIEVTDRSTLRDSAMWKGAVADPN